MKVREVLQKAAWAGYRVLAVEDQSYGFIESKKGNVIKVTRSPYGEGVIFCLAYWPTAKNGTCCSCMGANRFAYDWGVEHFDPDELDKYEEKGLIFARQLKAPLYDSFDQWLAHYYNREALKEVTLCNMN